MKEIGEMTSFWELTMAAMFGAIAVASGGIVAIHYYSAVLPNMIATERATCVAQLSDAQVVHTVAMAVKDKEIERLKGPVKFRAWLDGTECKMVMVQPR